MTGDSGTNPVPGFEPPLLSPAVVEVPTDKVQEIIDATPVEKQQELARIILEQSVLSKSHRGPLPTPEDLEQYNRIIPNGAERLMARYEKQSDHRIATEEKLTAARCRQGAAGQWMGFVLGTVGLVLGGVCICTGHDAAGAALGGTTLIGLVSVFVAGQTEIFEKLLTKRSEAANGEASEADSLASKRELAVEQPNP